MYKGTTSLSLSPSLSLFLSLHYTLITGEQLAEQLQVLKESRWCCRHAEAQFAADRQTAPQWTAAAQGAQCCSHCLLARIVAAGGFGLTGSEN